MTDLNKVKIAKILFSARFWVATIVLYLTSREISTVHVFQLISFYYVMHVILEYPTGVIGDYYSHRVSVFWGGIITALAFILLSLSGDVWIYVLALIVLALGGSLVSGSDDALLHDVSSDFKKDFSQVKTYGIVMTFLAISIGGFVSVVDLRIPLYLTAIFWIVATFFVFSVKKQPRGEMEESNIFSFAKEGLKHSMNNKQLLNLLVISSLVGAFFFSFKWLYNPLFLEMGLDVSSWGVLAGTATLLGAVGTMIYGKFSKLNIFVVTGILLVSVVLIGVTNFAAVAIFGLFATYLVKGYFNTKITVDINAAVGKSFRSSVLSLKALLIRGGATIFMFFGGMILEKTSMLILMIVSVVLFVILGTYSLVKIFGFEKKMDLKKI